MEWYLAVLQKKYGDFTGRATRNEYWYFVLFNFLISLGLGIIDNILGFASNTGVGLLGGIYGLAVLIPSLAVAVRRLHDTGRSGWWLLISLIPFAGVIVLIIFLASESQNGKNQYG